LIVRIEHDPNRSAKLCLLQDTVTKRLSYVLQADGMEPGQIVKNTPDGYGRRGIELASPVSVDAGACLPLSLAPLGSRLHWIETMPGQGGKLVRAAGTYATLVGRSADLAHSTVRLPSGIQKELSSKCRAVIGSVGNAQWHLRVIGKAGRNRNLGIRPHVRGVAMNAVDHPHGGGKGGRGKGKPSQSPWGKVCK
jgi:ribosomal protein L2